MDVRLKPSVPLPAGFSYPEEFLSYLIYEDSELRASSGTVSLHWCWPFELHFENEVTQRVLEATRASVTCPADVHLVAFARDAGDGVWFFGHDGIYVVDLGWDSWVALKEEHASFTAFVNYWREGSGLGPWQPEGHNER
jgi:hypothetical protein